METAVGAASWLIGKVLNKLSDDLVAAYVASSELGPNAEQIKDDLLYTQGLLHAAQGRDDNPGLKSLVEQLSEKADEAEDALDELHYFIIQDKLDGTQQATPFLGGDLREKVQHGRNAVRHTTGNWLSCFSCCRTKDAPAPAVTDNPQNKALHVNGSGHLDQFAFDRVAMSNKIKSVIEVIHSKCKPVSDLLKIESQNSVAVTTVTLKRTPKTSAMEEKKLYGRSIIFEKTIEGITGGTYHSESLYVLPIVGPGGIGKTTFTQHLYNDERTVQHFTIRVWVCVSTDFDVFKLTQQIHNCIPATEKQERNITNLDQLQKSITDRLKTKRFLLVLDDIWKCGSDSEWKTLLSPFTKGEAKGSMVLVTTRFPKVEETVKKSTTPINLRGLEPKEFLEFFQECAFGTSKPDEKYNDLIGIGTEIAHKLKCSPLAATTVARLLKKNLSWEHWSHVLENNEWKNQKNDDDIMPALKISYDYLPFHLKQCFSYFSLFPEDHRFTLVEITRFLTAICVVDSSCRNKNYLEDLVDNGFLMNEDQCYVLHDLLHELSRSVSSQQCVNISSGFSFSADDIPQSIRHLSITMEERDVENFRRKMAKLKGGINIGKLQSLMIFGEYGKRITDILNETFEEIKDLRVLFIVMNSPDSLPKNFSKLLHLRYLRISSPYGLEISLPSALPIFYHLIFLDLQYWHSSSSLPRYIGRLVNLRHFIANNELHSNVPEVGKIEHLEELKEFHVKKETVGFEMEELGKLTDLGGELCVRNLEKVANKEEAHKANLALKRNLKRLALVWGRDQPAADATDIVDGLQPHENLRELAIEDHGGAVGAPGWLCHDIPFKHLESLALVGVTWGTLPPFRQLPYLKTIQLKNIAGVRIIGPDLGFLHLKEVEFDGMPDLEKWVVGPNCHLFPNLESLLCKNCPKFVALPFFSDCLVPCTQDIHYPNLSEFVITECPQLPIPPMPYTSTLINVEVGDSTGTMSYNGTILEVRSYSSALAFENMGKVESIVFGAGSKIPWAELSDLTSLREFEIVDEPSFVSMALLSILPTSLTSLELIDCENLTVDGFNPLIAVVNLKVLVVFNTGRDGPRSVAADLLSELVVSSNTKLLLPAAGCFQLEHIEMDCISAVLAAPVCSLFATTLHKLFFSWDQLVESFTEEEEDALQLLTSLQTLVFSSCPGLPSLPQGLHRLSSLRELQVFFCPEIRSLPKGGLPTSLRKLCLWHCPEIRSLPTEGLPTSLQELTVSSCSPDLHKQAKELQGTKPDLRVTVYA